MLVRQFTENDAESFYSLAKEFYSSGATKRDYDQAIAEKTFHQVTSKHENLWGYFITDLEEQVVVGYALITSYWCHEENGNVIVLDELFISPSFRHKGFGKRFLSWLETEFHDKAVAITLDVLSTNVVAKELYNKAG
ncbi:MAG TPA: GNAT family N-acetyltransferase, partial [Clostridia bacterium]|nr:GNAT family N-acetyltransferase [Clostridia bacterium]